MDKLWLVQKLSSWQYDEQSGIEIVEEFVYKGTEESIWRLQEQYGDVYKNDEYGDVIEYIYHKEYKHPEIRTDFPESFYRK